MRTLFLLVGVVLTSIHPAEAQQKSKLPRVGFLSQRVSTTVHPFDEAFRQGLRDLGYVEGKNILVEYRYSEGKRDRIPAQVAELVQLKVDLLIVRSLPAIREAKLATKIIPIVMVTTQDPVATGLIDSLAHPGGNITGVTGLTRELSGKRLELLQDAIPGISRVGILLEANAPGSAFKDYETAAGGLKIHVFPLQVSGPNPDYERAFESAVKGRASAVIRVSGPLSASYPKRIADVAVKNQLALMHEGSEQLDAGGLMSYSANDLELFRRAASYVDKILKGANPADLPVEQPTKFELAINLKTAKQIGLTIPQKVLARADKVIK
jgi:putative tryptophan/tyrosine transport system substrate-binding protein